ncbi:MAG: peptide chain release factor N(5)-glutamine methyltransferase [candidate division KSB1 bacterium]|nr:peptide chain release factor N(5)-glutamine methyltransferase [candidate division KSB1 bacterium]
MDNHDEQRWKLLDILNLTTEHLKKKNFENPRLNAERLIGQALNMSRVELYLNFERPISPEELQNIRNLVQRRLKHEPLQYIIGETEFMSLTFKVNQHVLIPRPETEILVEKVMEKCKDKYQPEATISILDIGTGSGNIAISLAKYVKNSRVTAVDVQPSALEVATENARLNEVAHQVQFYLADIFQENFIEKFNEKFDVVVSNPPYVAKGDIGKLPDEIKKYEPLTALQGGSDGCRFYRRLAEISTQLLNKDGFVAFEIGQGQRETVTQILKESRFTIVQSFKDLNDIDRVVVAEKFVI